MLFVAGTALQAEDAVINLQASNGQWVCAEGGGGQDVVANRDAASGWETFVLHDLNGGSLESGDPVNIQASNGQYFCAEGGGGQQVVANRDTPYGWETFTIYKMNGGGSIGSGDQIALQCCNGQFVCAEGGGGQEVVANRDAVGGWETFNLVVAGSPGPGGGSATPQASLSPSTTSVLAGQTVTFTASGSCSSGLNEIGLEQCDSNGSPYANLGNVGAGGSSASQNFYWTAPAPGTYYFDSYAWNADRSQLTRTGITVISVTNAVSATPQASLSPSSTSVQAGQTVNFAVSGSCGSGLNEIGLEQCDASGSPFANLGAVGASGSSASQNFSWTAPAAGTYYFDSYAWNVDRSQLTRTGITVINVTGVVSSTPQATLSPSSTSVQSGQTVSFAVSGSCGTGLNEIGLEQCDASGSPFANLGASGVSGTSASQNFSWTAPAAGTYYFDSYAWNVDRSQLTRTSVVSVTVSGDDTDGNNNDDDVPPAPSDPSKPSIILSPSASSMITGQSINFILSSYCGVGLNEVGLEECNVTGAPINNLRAIASSNTYDQESIAWTAPAPGVYYFDAYAWNLDRSKIERTGVIAITVSGNNDDSTQGVEDDGDWGSDDFGGDDWSGDDCGHSGSGDQEFVTEDGHDYTIHANGSVTRHTDQGDYTFSPAGSGNYILTTPGGSVYAITGSQGTPGGTGPGVTTVTDNGQSLPVAFSGSDGSLNTNTFVLPTIPLPSDPNVVVLPPFIVNGNDPATFDWDGYYDFLTARGINWWDAPDPFTGTSYTAKGKGPLGQHPTNNTFPFAQSSNTSCGVNVVRNIIGILRGGPAQESEREIAQRMAASINQPVSVFEESSTPDDGDHGVTKPFTQFTAGLEPYGIEVGKAGQSDSRYNGLDEFKTLMQNAANQNSVFIADTTLWDDPGHTPMPLKPNHVVVMQPYNDNGILKIAVIDSGRAVNGQARVDTYNTTISTDLTTVANVPAGIQNSNGQPMSGNIRPVHLKPHG